jgi:hypothetical protein
LETTSFVVSEARFGVIPNFRDASSDMTGQRNKSICYASFTSSAYIARERDEKLAQFHIQRLKSGQTLRLGVGPSCDETQPVTQAKPKAMGGGGGGPARQLQLLGIGAPTIAQQTRCSTKVESNSESAVQCRAVCHV